MIFAENAVMRFVILFVIAASCTHYSGGQKAFHFENKGITTDALRLSDQSLLICGESSTGASKEGVLLRLNAKGEADQVIGLGDGQNAFRLEKLGLAAGQIVSSGYGFEDKASMVAGFGNNLELKWLLRADSLMPFEEPALCADSKGNVVVLSKAPSAWSPYYGVFTLINQEGKVMWNRKVDMIDVMSDIVALRNGDFLTCFKQKGAYIDGGTHKKYYMISVMRFTVQGELAYQVKFLVDREQFLDVDFNKVLESSGGELYFCGRSRNLANRTDLLVVKTDKGGKIIWSKTYQTNQEQGIKAATFDSKGNIVLVADSYGHSGGMLRSAIDPSGNVLWANFNKSTPYEQMRAVFTLKDGFQYICDRTLNMGVYLSTGNGSVCFGGSGSANLTVGSAEFILSNNTNEFQEYNAGWKRVEPKISRPGAWNRVDDCK